MYALFPALHAGSTFFVERCGSFPLAKTVANTLSGSRKRLILPR